MKYHIAFKFLAIMLCACFLLLSVGMGIGIAVVEAVGLYDGDPVQLQLQSMEGRLERLARDLARRYAATEDSNCTQEFLDRYMADHYMEVTLPAEDLWFYTLEDDRGTVLDQRYDSARAEDAYRFEYTVSVSYPVLLSYKALDAQSGEQITGSVYSRPDDGEGLPTEPPAEEDSEYLHIQTWGYQDEENVLHQYTLGILESPVYRVTLYLLPDACSMEEDWTWGLAQLGYTHRYNLIWGLGASLLLFSVTLVYLCCAAGRKPKCDEVQPAGLNRIPLDLYTAVCGIGAAVLAVCCYELINWHLDYFEPLWLLGLAIVAMVYVACLLVVAVLFAWAAQLKMRRFYWLKHSLVGMAAIGCFRLIKWLLKQLLRACRWLREKLPTGAKLLVRGAKWLWDALRKVLTTLWQLAKTLLLILWDVMGKLFHALWHGLRRFSELLPLTWQWLLTGCAMVFILILSLSARTRGLQWLGVFACIALVMYGAHCFGILLESAKRMGRGDLDTKVEDKMLLGSFREYASHLNALADVAMESAKKQMKSERMKAELVTNVSHDIKTPLTSIINYVDLLQKAETEEDRETCLEVLNRQSQRLKKLIEDLMEMSKASTGNLAVELSRVDAVEAVNQALGEFSEKLEKAQLIPVFEPPQEQVAMTADGRLTWRVLSNLLSNAVKYALPGTRLYIDLVELEGKVVISLKNISRERLNVSSQELMERFVRGDASRNTEGSGLGLNIAKSLMELQKGQLQLLVDGDLFKVTLIFPANREMGEM